jgi:DNA-binding response OmpR family regulator
MNVLLVEPDQVLSRIYTHALERVGHNVIWATSAQSAISAADETTPDVVVLEMQLPSHSGAAFLYEFRTYTDWLAIPVLVHTMIPPTQLKSFEKTLDELGITECLYKPQTSLLRLVSAIEAQVPTVI